MSFYSFFGMLSRLGLSDLSLMSQNDLLVPKKCTVIYFVVGQFFNIPTSS